MNDKNVKFAEAFAELQEINEWFQSDDPDLDLGLEKLKRGQELIKLCRGKLKQVENEFIKIKDDFVADSENVEHLEEEVEEVQNTKTKTDDEFSDIPF